MKLALVLFALVLAAGCKKDDAGGSGGGKVASCLAEAAQSCREYRGGNLALGTESLAELCTAVISSAKFTETACPIAKLIGTCATPEGKDFFYEGYAADAAKIAETCKSGGGTFGTR